MLWLSYADDNTRKPVIVLRMAVLNVHPVRLMMVIKKRLHVISLNQHLMNTRLTRRLWRVAVEAQVGTFAWIETA
jgi:hypothetical protein